jgi:hypothetical protein
LQNGSIGSPKRSTIAERSCSSLAKNATRFELRELVVLDDVAALPAPLRWSSISVSASSTSA